MVMTMGARVWCTGRRVLLVKGAEVDAKTNRFGRCVLDCWAGRRRTGTVILKRGNFAVAILFGVVVLVVLVLRAVMAVVGRVVLGVVLRVVVLVG